MNGDVVDIALGFLQGFLSSSVFILGLFIGFCVVLGFLKTKQSAGGVVVKSLEEAVSLKPVHYLAPTAPRGIADQLKAPELLEVARRA